MTDMTDPTTAELRERDLWSVARAYAATLLLVVIGGAAATAGGADPIWRVAIADVVGTMAIFGFSLLWRNASAYDAYWSVAPPVIALYWLSLPAGDDLRGALVLTLVFAWAGRLTWNWATGWTGMGHQDWRYTMLREKTGFFYPLVNLFGIHLFPTAQVFLGCLALYPALTSDAPLGLLDGLAALVTGGAILIEGVADLQVRAFARRGPAPGAVMDLGLWSVSRHPNYLGEIGFWWGLWLFGVSADPAAWGWTVIGPLAITVMFLVISIPMIERRHRTKRPAYTDYQARVPMLLPRPTGSRGPGA